MPFIFKVPVPCNSNYISGQNVFRMNYLEPRQFTVLNNTSDTEDLNWKLLNIGTYMGPPYSFAGGEQAPGYDGMVVGSAANITLDATSGKTRWHWYFRSCINPINIASLTRSYNNGSSHAPGFIVRRWADTGVQESNPNSGTAAWETMLSTSTILPNPATFAVGAVGYYWWLTIYKFQAQTVDLNAQSFALTIQ